MCPIMSLMTAHTQDSVIAGVKPMESKFIFIFQRPVKTLIELWVSLMKGKSLAEIAKREKSRKGEKMIAYCQH